MKIGKAFPSKYLKAADLEGDEIVTIDRVEMEWVGQGQDAEEKPVIHFREREQGLVLNVTNANTIADLIGTDETDHWSGKRICLFACRVQFGSKMVDAIRVKEAVRETVAVPIGDNGDEALPF